MRLLVYYNPRKDKFVTNYNADRQHPLPLFTYNCYGNLIVQYIYIEDNQVFWNSKDYRRYLDHKYKISLWKKIDLKYKIGQGLIKLGRFICFGREEKVRYIYVNKSSWWK